MSTPANDAERHEETMELAVATARITVAATLLAIGGVGLALLGEPVISGDDTDGLGRLIVAVVLIVVLLVSYFVFKKMLNNATPARLR